MKKIVIVILFLGSCVYDPPKPKIVNIKNATNTNVILLYGADSISDGRLFYGAEIMINAKTTCEVYGYVPLPSQDNKIHFFFFNKDSVEKYIRSNKQKGIVKSSFLKEYSLELNSFKKEDTLTYR